MAARTASPSRVRLAVCGVLLALYAVVVLAMTMSPLPLDTNYGAAIVRLLNILHRHGVPEWFGYDKLEFTANIAMYLPLGFLLALTLPQRAWWLVFLLIPASSGLIEYTQGQLLAARVESVWDVLANSIGGYLGAIVAYAVRDIVHMRDRLVIERALATRG